MPRSTLKSEAIFHISNNALVALEGMDIDDDSREIDLIVDTAFDEIETILWNRYFIARSNKILKSKEWWVKILPQVDEKIFKHELRVSRKSFHNILEMIRSDETFTHWQLSVELQLAIALSRFGEYGTGSSWLKKASKFAIGEGTIQLVTRRVIKAINNQKRTWISWPNSNERLKMCDFMSNKLPKCVGYMDGTHIKLEEAPINDHESYYTRKQQYAIQLQAVVDNDKKIRHLHIGFPGSVHDSRVFANSDIGRVPEKYMQDEQWIGADSAYTLSTFVITPFRKNSPLISENDRVKFQKYFSKFRVKVENAFGILKEIFGSLKELRTRVNKLNGHQEACEWILCCCILYNIILPEIDENEFDFIYDEDNLDLETHNQQNSVAEQKRIKLIH